MNHDLIAPAASEHARSLELLASRFVERAVALPSGATVMVRTAGSTAAETGAIVLLHGISSGSASWLHVALALGDDARVVAWDAPGYAASTALESATPMAADYARRLDEMLVAMDIRSCVLVGHSLGALMAAALVSSPAGGRVRRLVLISPARGYGAGDQADARQKVRESRLRTLREAGVEGMAIASPKRLLGPTASDAARAWVSWNVARLNPAGYAQAVQMLCNDDIDRYAEVKVPVDVLCGEADVVTSPEACARVARRFGSDLELIPQAGHASPVEQPSLVARRIARAATASREEARP